MLFRAEHTIELDCGKCRLRPFRADDALSLAHHANNPRVAANLRDRFPNPYTRAHAESFIRSRMDAMSDREFVLGIEVGGDVVGAIGLVFFDDIERQTAELGYWLGEQFWGKGIVSAAIPIFTEWTMREFRLARIFAKPFTDNIGSVRVLEKAGYVCEGTLRKAAIKDGEYKDFYMFAVVK